MSQTNDPKEQLLRDALDSYKEEYSELSEIWRNLDGKAQGAIAVSGIFLAGMLAFVRALLQSASSAEKWLLTVSAIFLVLSIIFALIVLWVRTVPKAPLGESLEILINDLLSMEDGTEPERLHNFSRDHARMWKITNIEIQKVNEKKAFYLVWAQGMLIMAIGTVVLFTLIKVWSF